METKNTPINSQYYQLVNYPKVPVNCLIEQQVNKYPNKPAVLFKDQSLSYLELNQRANRLANYLIKKGFSDQNLIGIYMDRSFDMIVSILAVIKMGASYIPLDSSYPLQRINYIINDAQAALIITQASLLKDIEDVQIEKMCIDKDNGLISECSDQNIACGVDIEKQRVYVIYTSGTTGNPKGVQISHSALVNFLASMGEKPGITQDDRILFITTICFDISGLELFLPLVSGSTIVMATHEEVTSGIELANIIDRHDITIMQATPATWQILLDMNWKGKQDLKMLCGGEAMTRELANKLLAKGAELWNMYGPTETTIWSMIHKVEQCDAPISLGEPIDNTQIYILDEEMKKVADGEIGELFIGGDGLSIGYLGKLELTKKRFLPNPFKEDPSAYIYKTGDLVKRNNKGDIEYIGRVDFQVKIRGHRIELGEIETILEKHLHVNRAVAVVNENSLNDKKIIVYYQKNAPNVDIPEEELRNTLKEALPDYMMPAFIIPIQEFPLTLNGKIDRSKLMTLQIQHNKHASEYVPPNTPVEKEIVTIWEEMLELDQISITDNFLELGGHSLLANRILSRINYTYDIQLTLLEILTKGLTVFDMAKLVEEKLFESISEAELEEMLKELNENFEEDIDTLINN